MALFAFFLCYQIRFIREMQTKRQCLKIWFGRGGGGFCPKSIFDGLKIFNLFLCWCFIDLIQDQIRVRLGHSKAIFHLTVWKDLLKGAFSALRDPKSSSKGSKTLFISFSFKFQIVTPGQSWAAKKIRELSPGSVSQHKNVLLAFWKAQKCQVSDCQIEDMW